MRRLTLSCLTLLAALISLTALSTSASALTLPENLPVSATERTFTGKAAGATLLQITGGTIEPLDCETAPSEGGEEAGKPLGPFHIHFTKCTTKSGGTTVTCTGLSEAAGIILVLGTWHLVFDEKSPELLTAMLFLLETTHYNCSALVLVELTGSVLCLELKVTEQSVTHSFHCIQTSGVQSETKYFTSTGAEATAGLKCSVNHATAVGCGWLALFEDTFKEAIFADI